MRDGAVVVCAWIYLPLPPSSSCTEDRFIGDPARKAMCKVMCGRAIKDVCIEGGG